MQCLKCGNMNDEDSKFCESCGARLTGNIPPEPKPVTRPESGRESGFAQSNSVQSSSVQTSSAKTLPKEYEPIGMWGYFGYQILFSIPLVGIICQLVFAFGGTANVNLKNFARSYFCYTIILIGIVVLFPSILTAIIKMML